MILKEPEIWKTVSGYEGIYQISSYGRILSLSRKVKANNGYVKQLNETIKKPRYRKGYLAVDLHKNGKVKTFYVHRLVAEAFLSPFTDKKVINHINGNKMDNYYRNLEWSTYRDNNVHAIKTGLQNTKKKSVAALTTDNRIVLENSSGTLAKKIIDDQIVYSDSVDNVSREIRRCANDGRSYKQVHFLYISIENAVFI